MPLVENLFKEGDEHSVVEQKSGHDHENHLDDSIEHTFPEKTTLHQFYDAYEEFDNDQDDDDEAMLTRSGAMKKVPDLPQRSHLRASRVLDNLDLKTLNQKKIEDQVSLYSNPHDSYLSSEEDGSASGDDYEDVVSDAEESDDKSASVRRHSYEETAQAISFKCVKPQLIEINHSPISYHQRPVSLAPSRSNTLPMTLPPRSSSRPSLAIHTFIPPSNESKSATHSFLSSDPFPTQSPMSELLSPTHILTYVPSRGNTTPSPQTAKSDKSSSNWGSLRAVSRTLAMARKKASMPKINLAYNAGVAQKRDFTSPTQSGASTSSSSIASVEPSGHPSLPRRRSQTIDKLVVNARDERPGSEYMLRRDQVYEDWKGTISPDSPVESKANTKPTVIASMPAFGPSSSRPSLNQRPRSHTLSNISSSSTYSRPESSFQTETSDTTNSSNTSIASPTTSTSAQSSAESQSQSQPQSQYQPKPQPQYQDLTPSPETLKARRMTALPDYSRSSRSTRLREEQLQRGSVDAATLMSPGGSGSPVGNTYQDIMRSVGGKVVVGEGGKEKEKEKEKEKVVKARGSMAMFRRKGGVKT